MAAVTIKLRGPLGWVVLVALAVLLIYIVVHDLLSPSRLRLLASSCDGYSGVISSKGTETTLLRRWRNRLYFIVVRDDVGKESRYRVSANDWGKLPEGSYVEKKPGCSEVPMTVARKFLRAHPELIERLRNAEGLRR
jgi:hypothetical protein